MSYPDSDGYIFIFLIFWFIVLALAVGRLIVFIVDGK